MKAWSLLVALALVGCASREVPDRVAFRGPDVTIDVESTGRAEKIAKSSSVRPAPKPKSDAASSSSTAAAKKEPSDDGEPKPKPKRRRPKPKPESEAPDSERPTVAPGEVVIFDDAGNPLNGDEMKGEDSSKKNKAKKPEKPKKPKKEETKLPPDEDFYPDGRSSRDARKRGGGDAGGGDDGGLGLYPVNGGKGSGGQSE